MLGGGDAVFNVMLLNDLCNLMRIVSRLMFLYIYHFTFRGMRKYFLKQNKKTEFFTLKYSMKNIRSKKMADFPFDTLHIFLLKNRDLKWETGSFSCRLDECFNYDTLAFTRGHITMQKTETTAYNIP